MGHWGTCPLEFANARKFCRPNTRWLSLIWITLSPRTSEPVRHAPVPPPWSKILATPLPIGHMHGQPFAYRLLWQPHTSQPAWPRPVLSSSSSASMHLWDDHQGGHPRFQIRGGVNCGSVISSPSVLFPSHPFVPSVLSYFFPTLTPSSFSVLFPPFRSPLFYASQVASPSRASRAIWGSTGSTSAVRSPASAVRVLCYCRDFLIMR